MTDRIILSIIVVPLLIISILKKDKWSIIIASGLTFGVLITWTGIPLVISAGLLIYAVSALLSVVYAFFDKELKGFHKLIIAFMGLISFYAQLSMLMHLPGANGFRLFMVIPLIGYVVLISTGLLKKKPLGFVTIINSEFAVRFMHLVQYWI